MCIGFRIYSALRCSWRNSKMNRKFGSPIPSFLVAMDLKWNSRCNFLFFFSDWHETCAWNTTMVPNTKVRSGCINSARHCHRRLDSPVAFHGLNPTCDYCFLLPRQSISPLRKLHWNCDREPSTETDICMCVSRVNECGLQSPRQILPLDLGRATTSTAQSMLQIQFQLHIL